MSEGKVEEFVAKSPTRKRSGGTRTLSRVLGYARPVLGWLGLAALCTVLFSAGRYARAYLVKPLLDNVLVPVGERTPGATEHALTEILLAAAVIVVVTPLALFGRLYLSEFALGRIHVRVQQALAAKLLALPLSTHARRHSGDLLARLQSDAPAIRDLLKLAVQELLLSGVMILIGLATLLYLSVPLTLVALAVAPIIAAVLIGFGRRVRRRAERRQERLGELVSRLVSILGGIKVIKAFGAESTERDAFANETERVFRADLRVTQGRVLAQATIEALNSAAGFLVLAIGAFLVLQGRFGLTTGAVAAFALTLATTYRPVKNLAKGYGRMMERLASVDRTFALLDEPGEADRTGGAVPLGQITEAIELEGVGLVHRDPSGVETRVLRDIDLRLSIGEVVAIVGRSGAGKTSLADVILGLARPTEGQVRIDGVAADALDGPSARRRMAVVTQEAFLFDASVAENIRFGRPAASEAEVAAVAKAAHVDAFARDLPEGLATPVGELGVRLSGGQRQRIAIARALLRNPDVLVFDEATSALDPQTEAVVRETIDALRGERLIVVISHRMASVRDAGRIVVVEDGRIAEVGPHDALWAANGPYRALADA